MKEISKRSEISKLDLILLSFYSHIFFLENFLLIKQINQVDCDFSRFVNFLIKQFKKKTNNFFSQDL